MSAEILESWKGGQREPAEVSMDCDGDCLILDSKNYSIVLSPTGARALRDWLIENYKD